MQYFKKYVKRISLHDIRSGNSEKNKTYEKLFGRVRTTKKFRRRRMRRTNVRLCQKLHVLQKYNHGVRTSKQTSNANKIKCISHTKLNKNDNDL